MKFNKIIKYMTRFNTSNIKILFLEHTNKAKIKQKQKAN